MNSSGHRFRPLTIALLALAVVYLVVLRLSLGHTGGRLVYALDDPYIHMAIAKNLVAHGVWGVTPHGFTSASSSPLWVLMLAASYWLFGPNELSPCLFDAASAVLLVVVSDRALRRLGVSPGPRTVALLALLFLTPIVPVAFCGLEHLLHAALSVALAAAVAEEVAGGPPPRLGYLMALAATTTGTRYEGLFLVAAGALLLAARRLWTRATLLVLAGVAPAVAYGLYARHRGWPFLPTSLLLKARIPGRGWGTLLDFAGRGCLETLAKAPHMWPLLLAGGAALVVARRRGGSLRAPWSALVLLALMASLLHLELARVGWFYRYEAYLISLWIVALAAAWPHLASDVRHLFRLGPLRAATAGALAALAALAIGARAAGAHLQTPTATGEIYAQQYQMGLFVRRFFPERGVAANDIGALDYLADIDLLDLVGLASLEAMSARRDGTDYGARMGALARARGIEIAIAYESWFTPLGGLPLAWQPIAEWTIPTQVVAASSRVTFLAADPRVAPELARSLRDFAPDLPATVSVRLLSGATRSGGPK